MTGSTESRVKLEKLARRLRAGRDVLEELALEVEAILEDKATPGQQAKAFLDGWCEEWAAAHRGEKYHVHGAKDMAQIKRVLKTFTLDDLTERRRRYLQSRDPFYTQARHSLALFLGAVNKFGGTTTADDDETFLAAPPPDCRHSPACKTDAAHTRRLALELRA